MRLKFGKIFSLVQLCYIVINLFFHPVLCCSVECFCESLCSIKSYASFGMNYLVYTRWRYFNHTGKFRDIHVLFLYYLF